MEPPGWGKHARKFYLWGVCGSGKLTGPRLGEPVPAPAARPMHRQRMPLSNGIGRDLEQVVKLGRGAFPSQGTGNAKQDDPRSTRGKIGRASCRERVCQYV